MDALAMQSWTAVIIACGHNHEVGGLPVSLNKVAGLSVVGRHVKAALHGGASRCCLVAGPDDQALVAEARKCWNRPDGFSVVQVEKDTTETDCLRLSVEDADQAVCVLFADLSFSRNLLQGLLQDGLADTGEYTSRTIRTLIGA